MHIRRRPAGCGHGAVAAPGPGPLGHL